MSKDIGWARFLTAGTKGVESDQIQIRSDYTLMFPRRETEEGLGQGMCTVMEC